MATVRRLFIGEVLCGERRQVERKQKREKADTAPAWADEMGVLHWILLKDVRQGETPAQS
jgi:hypothetical protein